MRSYRKRNSIFASLVAVALLSGCGSNPPQGPTIDPLEQNAINALAKGGEPDRALAAALARYRANDDLAGQWRVHYLLAQYALSKSETEAAINEARQMERLSRLLNNRETDYETALILGRTTGDTAHFTRALELSSTALERAVVTTYLGSPREAIELIDVNGTSHPDDRAFIHYRHARQTGDPEHYAKALAYYRLAGDSRGVADSLVALARTSASRGQSAQARDYAGRAINVLNAIGDGERAEAVTEWLEGL